MHVPFGIFLLILSLLNSTFTVAGLFDLYTAGKKTERRKLLAAMSIALVVIGQMCISISAIVPTSINQPLHETFAINYFILYPVGIFISSAIVPKKFSDFTSFTRYLVVLCLAGTYVLYRLVLSAVPAEMYYVLMVGVWMLVFYAYVLRRIDDK